MSQLANLPTPKPPPLPRSGFALKSDNVSDKAILEYLGEVERLASEAGAAGAEMTQPSSSPAPASVRSQLPPVAVPPPPPGRLADLSPDQAILEQLRDFEKWASANAKVARWDNLRFWLFKGLAFVGAACAAASQALGHPQPVVVLGLVAAAFIAIDAGWHGGLLHNAQRRAIDELRQLQNAIKLRWDRARLANPDARSPARFAEALQILQEVQAKRDELAKYLVSVDTNEMGPRT